MPNQVTADTFQACGKDLSNPNPHSANAGAVIIIIIITPALQMRKQGLKEAKLPARVTCLLSG